MSIKAKGGKKGRKIGRHSRAPSNRNQAARTAANKLRRIAKAERERNKNR
jgi:hypothetical protein